MGSDSGSKLASAASWWCVVIRRRGIRPRFLLPTLLPVVLSLALVSPPWKSDPTVAAACACALSRSPVALPSMGQDQSRPAAVVEEPSPPAAQPEPAPSASSSLETLAAEAMSFSEDDNESIDVKVQKALECPCVADLKNGPCGSGFVDAFSCFLRSTEVEKGSDCVQPFIALQNCIKENPEAFSKEILEEEENDDEAEKSNLKVRAPAWSRESKPKL